MTKWANPMAVEELAADWSDKVVACRTYGHNWTPSSVVRAGLGFVVKQRCRCGTTRQQDMDSRGYASAWRYGYATNYLCHDLGRIDGHGRAVLRLAALRNLTILDPEE